MKETFFDFISNTTSENFRSSQQFVFEHEGYNPYSEDLDILEVLLDEDNLSNASEYNNINVLLSPRAHLYKHYAFDKLGKTNEAKTELLLAQKIMEGISLTGDGTKEKPYIVTRVSDEKDMLSYFKEQFSGQSLIHDENKILDLIKCISGKEIYFDITNPFLKMKELMDSGKIESRLQKMIKQKPIPKKKWWEFWK